VREAEEALASRDALAAEQRGAASAEADQLRERIVALTDSNRALQVAASPRNPRAAPLPCCVQEPLCLGATLSLSWPWVNRLACGCCCCRRVVQHAGVAAVVASISLRVLPLSSRVYSLGGLVN
jgi:hypothetical protein